MPRPLILLQFQLDLELLARVPGADGLDGGLFAVLFRPEFVFLGYIHAGKAEPALLDSCIAANGL